MKNKFLFAITGLIILLWFPSCKDEPFEYKIDRQPAFSFKLDTFDLVVTDEVVFFEGPTIIHEFEDSTQVMFQRISLQAHGVTPKNYDYWFIVDFDTNPDGENTGIYTTTYDKEDGGISDMRLIIDYNGDLLEFTAIPDANLVFFQVEAQREEERIMKGSFGGKLYLEGNINGQPALITQGIFKDIKY